MTDATEQLPSLWVRGHGLCNLTDRFPGFDALIRRLSTIPRFGGDTPEWSVLHHSFLVGFLVGLPGFFHDFGEAWGFGDISTPCKNQATRELEMRCRSAILEHLPYHRELEAAWHRSDVKGGDAAAMQLELQAFFDDSRGVAAPVIARLLRRVPDTLRSHASRVCSSVSYDEAAAALQDAVYPAWPLD